MEPKGEKNARRILFIALVLSYVHEHAMNKYTYLSIKLHRRMPFELMPDEISVMRCGDVISRQRLIHIHIVVNASFNIFILVREASWGAGRAACAAVEVVGDGRVCRVH